MSTVSIIITVLISFIIGCVSGLIFGWIKGYDRALDHSGIIHGKDSKKFHEQNTSLNKTI